MEDGDGNGDGHGRKEATVGQGRYSWVAGRGFPFLTADPHSIQGATSFRDQCLTHGAQRHPTKEPC